MTDSPYGPPPEGYGQPAPGYVQPGYGQPPAPGYGQPPAPWGYGPPGRLRGTGFGIFMFIITIGFYSCYWYYVVHDEMKRHSGQGLGGGASLAISLVSTFTIGNFIMPFLTSSEIGNLYGRAGQSKPVTGATGLWVMPGIILIFLPIVWFVKTNGAINSYWRAHGVV